MTRIQGARAAAHLRRELGVEATLVNGRYGELTVFVDGEEVINGGSLAYLGVLPSLDAIRDAVAAKLTPQAKLQT